MKIDYLKNYNQFINLVWIFFGIVIWFLYLPIASALEGGLFALSIIVCAYPFTTYLSKHLLNKAIKQKKMPLFVGQFILVSAFIALLIPFILYLFLYLEEIGFFTPSEMRANEGSFVFEFLNAFLIALFVNFGFCGLRFYELNLELQQELIESKLDTLQGQITPHFMFNVLNHIHILMQNDVELASSLLIKYSDILRYQLYSARSESISLDMEIEFLSNFIDIERIRWADNLNINCSWEVEDKKKEIAPLLLITFIENAFKHSPRDDFEKGFVNINFRQTGNIVCLDVQNSKSTIAINKSINSGLGLNNTRKRLDILYPERYEITINETDSTYHTNLLLRL